MPVLLRILALSFLINSAPLHAVEDGAAQFGAQATVPAVCNFSSQPRVVAAQNMTLSSGGDATRVNVSSMFDEATATLKPGSITLAVLAICNLPHQVGLSTAAGVMRPLNPQEARAPFIGEVRYRAIARWGSQNLMLIADGSGPKSVNVETAHAAVGEFHVEIKVDGTDNDLTIPVVADTYSDIIVLHIAARL